MSAMQNTSTKIEKILFTVMKISASIVISLLIATFITDGEALDSDSVIIRGIFAWAALGLLVSTLIYAMVWRLRPSLSEND